MPFNKPGFHFNTRYFLAINISLLLISLGFLLIPLVQALGESTHKAEKLKILFLSIFTTSMMALGLFYSIKKGDLSWVKSFRVSRKNE